MKKMVKVMFLVKFSTVIFLGSLCFQTAQAAELNLELSQEFLDKEYKRAKKFEDYNAENGVLVLGVNMNTALAFSGVNDSFREYDELCMNEKHAHGNFGNHWCHAYFSKLAYRVAKDLGYNEWVAQGVGVSVFLIKENFDKNYDWSDVSTAPIGGTFGKNKSTEAYVTLFMDGTFYIEYRFSHK